MHLHILGICGTFMAGIAALAREAGHQVSGSDANAWPPMSTQLEQLGIELKRGYDPAHLDPAPDMVIVGNVVSRGNPAMEYVLDQGLPYTSGPQWLAEHVLQGRHVLAVAGTHGKTTTTSLLTWILDQAGLAPGFLIGGVPLNFGVSARLGGGRYFVVEADEYDTAFFDKRSKFVHYRPRTVILNNLEFDHADIFPDLGAIERQFSHLIRTVPRSGRLIVNASDTELARVINKGCWSEVQRFALEHQFTVQPADWTITRAQTPTDATAAAQTADEVQVNFGGRAVAHGASALLGDHNLANSLAAIAAANHVGVSPQVATTALASFHSVRRRLEKVGEVNGISVYDDFAHHPTAITVTIAALRQRLAQHSPAAISAAMSQTAHHLVMEQQHPTPVSGRVIAVLEPRSNTMRLGNHATPLADSLRNADLSFVYARADLNWDAESALGDSARIFHDHESLVAAVCAEARAGDSVLVMSNGDFGGMPVKIRDQLAHLATRDLVAAEMLTSETAV